MATNCLVTKLKDVVNNDELPILNGVKIKAKARTVGVNAFLFLGKKSNTDIKVTCPVAFSVYTTNAVTGETIEAVVENVTSFNWTWDSYAHTFLKFSVPTDGTEVTYIVNNKYALTKIRTTALTAAFFNADIRYNLDDLAYNDGLKELENASGDVKALYKSKNGLSVLYVYNNDAYGNFNEIFSDSLSRLNLGLQVSLDFDTLEAGDRIETLIFPSNKNVVGDVYEWALRLWNNGTGRTSGAIAVTGVGSGATLGSYSWGNSTRTITFSAEGVTVS